MEVSDEEKEGRASNKIDHLKKQSKKIKKKSHSKK